MRTVTKLTVTLVAVMGLWLTAVGAIDHNEAGATTAINVQQANPTITISTDSPDPKYSYTFNPAQLDAKVGQSITVTNEDPNGVHSVTAKDKTFNVDVPPKSSVTFTVKTAGSFPYYCTYHSELHNPASINVS